MLPIYTNKQNPKNNFISAQSQYFICRSVPVPMPDGSLKIVLIDTPRYSFRNGLLEEAIQHINRTGVPITLFNTNRVDIFTTYGRITQAIKVDDLVYAVIRRPLDIHAPMAKYNVHGSDEISITMRAQYDSRHRPVIITDILGFHLSGVQ